MLILASQSPRRQELLRRSGFVFQLCPASIAETPLPGELPEEYVQRLANEKARAVEASPDDIVLGADTVVVVDRLILEKPQNQADAARMLRLLSGREHEVLTGICLLSGEKLVLDLARTKVRFSPLSAREIRDYVASGEPMDKAGAYAIQGLASRFVERIEGCYFNVVGLPVSLVYRRLRDFGVQLEAGPAASA